MSSQTAEKFSLSATKEPNTAMVKPLLGSDAFPATCPAFPSLEFSRGTQGPKNAYSPLDLPHTSRWGPGAALAALPG